jgi:hypothetical protein
MALVWRLGLVRMCMAGLIEAPNGLPGAMPAGAVARKRRPQQLQRPPNSSIRVTTGAIGGMSM